MSLSYIIALLSKETALVVPVLILLYSCAFGKKTKKNALAGLLIAAILYVIFRSTIFQSVPVHMDRFATVVPRIPGIFVALVKYLSLLLFPFGTHMNYGLKFFSFFDPNVLAAAIIVAVLIIYTIKKRKLYPLLFFSAGWFFVTLLPALNIYPLDSYMAERYLYLPSWGFFLALAWGLSRLYKNNKLWCLGLSAFLIVSYSFLTIKQNNYWKDPISLYGATLRQEPDNYRIHEALAGEYYLEGRVNKAIEEYLKAIEINPGYGRAYGNLGNVFCKQGKIKQAVFMYMKAINSRSEKDVIGAAYYNLGNLYLSIGKDSQAVELYRKAVEIIPAMAAAHNNLAVLYYYNKDYGLAVKHYNQARKLGYNVHPDFKKAIDNYAGTTR
jgi:tetratricopeptide (TPR) repeat protein